MDAVTVPERLAWLLYEGVWMLLHVAAMWCSPCGVWYCLCCVHDKGGGGRKHYIASCSAT